MKASSLLVLCGLLLGSVVVSAQEDGEIDWRHRATQDVVTLTANPLGRASRTAFYAARGFPETAIRPYLDACGFSFGMQNTADRRIQVTLSDWHAIGADGARVAFTPMEIWDALWEKAGVSQSARIAFRWAQFQSENIFEPGDWIMGMATLKSAPQAPFRLVARYQDNKGNHEIILDKLECVRD